MTSSRIKTGIKLLGEGNNVNIYSYINERGEDITDKYISGLKKQDELKIVRLFQFMLENGSISNPEKFKYLADSDGIFEFKSGAHRILCFIMPGFQPKSFILTHGFKKESGKTPKNEIRKTEQIKKILLQLYKNDELKVYNE